MKYGSCENQDRRIGREQVSYSKSVGWAKKSVNPIKGLCQGNCKLPDGQLYCYYSGDRGISKRFGIDPELRLDLSVFDKLPKKPSRFFLQSTNDIFGSWIRGEWRDEIFKKVSEYPQHIFIVLTKQPHLIDRKFPGNVWIGTSIINKANGGRISSLGKILCDVKIISFEPIIGVPPLLDHLNYYFKNTGINWVIVGKLTGFGHQYDPKLEWIERIVEIARRYQIPVFLKDNLKNIWPGKLIQEIPNLLKKKEVEKYGGDK